MSAVIDHLVVTADRLDTASDHVTAALGLAMGPGGRHALMATHNRLVGLGPDEYLEALAPDPEAAAPGRARWFGLDAGGGAARLSGWALRVDDLDACLERAPEGIGPAVSVSRGDFRWRISVPEDGRQPFDGLFPALIAWESDPPQSRLADPGARLVSLTLTHPAAGRLGWALSMLSEDDRVTVRKGPVGLRALIHTEAGERELA